MTTTFRAITMPVNQKVADSNGKGIFAKVGEATIYVPILSDLQPFVSAEVAKDEKGQPMEDEGIPVYVSDEANWLQGAVLAMVKAQARNKLQPKTADLKPGNTIATNWAELCAEGTRGGGAGLAIAREAKAAFAEWIATQGLSENAANTLQTLFGNRAALQLQREDIKDKVKARIMAWGESLTPEMADRFDRPLSAVLEACEATKADMEF